eukprot:scaffold5340_cov257-Pinguiococcus_pyrenoidosus.AAC.6
MPLALRHQRLSFGHFGQKRHVLLLFGVEQRRYIEQEATQLSLERAATAAQQFLFLFFCCLPFLHGFCEAWKSASPNSATAEAVGPTRVSMGNGTSAEDAEKVGFRVLGVQSDSPASEAKLINFFDFIVSAAGVPLRTLDATFVELIEKHVDQPLPITVYNCKDNSQREVTITPSSTWGGIGLLGVTIRFDTYANMEESLVRVLEVARHSPAEIAGLKAGEDYLLGDWEEVWTGLRVWRKAIAHGSLRLCARQERLKECSRTQMCCSRRSRAILIIHW